uniref:C2 domain-containing protein n=1 Tax=Chromera velia CCMP2878 TaxID=1169474 RepID=A0A0G4GW51_9ALVE|eukprot:Cvel_23621.t1-p1 / transcript=Cvel_23621.t1 / gene=Cvel_23621 / organism=Chromera_velia_CCMP2878 / gene_product=hypothetical protein / transcript_product=hypothetical protein / location=Cvel_scaffold2454:6638-16731(+) / protein_length=738 / sequence_SO=supercontig / SO=protein_coding / is_pseudo=false
MACCTSRDAASLQLEKDRQDMIRRRDLALSNKPTIQKVSHGGILKNNEQKEEDVPLIVNARMQNKRPSMRSVPETGDVDDDSDDEQEDAGGKIKETPLVYHSARDIVRVASGCRLPWMEEAEREKEEEEIKETRKLQPRKSVVDIRKEREEMQKDKREEAKDFILSTVRYLKKKPTEADLKRTDVELGNRDPFSRAHCILEPQRALERNEGFAVLKLLIVGARNLKTAEYQKHPGISRTPDPFFKASLNGVVFFRSAVYEQQSEPRFDQEIHMQIIQPQSTVRVVFFDRDSEVLQGDDELGFVEIPVETLQAEKVEKMWLPLSPPQSTLLCPEEEAQAKLNSQASGAQAQVLVAVKLERLAGLWGTVCAHTLPEPEVAGANLTMQMSMAQQPLDVAQLYLEISGVRRVLFGRLLLPLLAVLKDLVQWRHGYAGLVPWVLICAWFWMPLYRCAAFYAIAVIFLSTWPVKPLSGSGRDSTSNSPDSAATGSGKEPKEEGVEDTGQTPSRASRLSVGPGGTGHRRSHSRGGAPLPKNSFISEGISSIQGAGLRRSMTSNNMGQNGGGNRDVLLRRQSSLHVDKAKEFEIKKTPEYLEAEKDVEVMVTVAAMIIPDVVALRRGLLALRTPLLHFTGTLKGIDRFLTEKGTAMHSLVSGAFLLLACVNFLFPSTFNPMHHSALFIGLFLLFASFSPPGRLFLAFLNFLQTPRKGLAGVPGALPASEAEVGGGDRRDGPGGSRW